MGQSSPAPSNVRPLKSRWLRRSATAFHSIVLPPTPRLRSESNPTLPGRIVGIWRLGKSNGIACVLKSVRVFTRGPPSTMATRDAAAGEVRREGASGRAGPDDDDVEAVSLHARPDDCASEGERRQPLMRMLK